MNYLDWKNQDAKTQYELLTQAGIPIIVMEPVRGGKLANDVPKKAVEQMKNHSPQNSIASWAIKFVASYKNVITILSGMNSTEQMQDNLNTLTDFQPMNEVEFQICKNTADLINKSDIIPCTVKISTIFSVYNRYKNGELFLNESREEYRKIDVNANACVSCGKCKSHCPQSIDIPKMLSTIKELYS